nr:HTH domain-containing protein [Segatella buccae]
MVNIRYSKGNLTIKDLSEEYGVSTRTIYRKLTKSYKEELPGLLIRPVVVLMDVTYWGGNFGVVIMKDSLSGNVLWYKFINRHERLEDYKEGITYLDSLGYTIQAIVCDGFKGLRQAFPNYKFQLCQFHQVMTIKTKLTSRPKLEASKELLAISKMLCHTDKESFIGALEEWYTKWEGFLKERTITEDGKSHYTHKTLRSAFLSLKRNMPWLWTFYEHPELDIPNTNNGIESLNADLKTKLNLHKGISTERRKVFIQNFIKSHSPNR